MIINILRRTTSRCYPGKQAIFWDILNNTPNRRPLHGTMAPNGKFSKYIKSLFPATKDRLAVTPSKKTTATKDRLAVTPSKGNTDTKDRLAVTRSKKNTATKDRLAVTPSKENQNNSKYTKKKRKKGPNLLKTLSSPDLMPDYLFQLQKSNDRAQLPAVNFEAYISETEYEQGLQKGELIQGVIRINPRNFRLAYISHPNGTDRDIVIEGVEARNRALPGDIVGVQILPEDQWRGDDRSTKTGKVVYMATEKHSRVACGMLRQYRNHRFGFALFSPVDRRLPRLMIPLSECPDDFTKDVKAFEKTLYVANVSSWNQNMPFANGKVTRSLGETGLIGPETEAILLNNDIDSSPFSDQVLRCLPDVDTWKVSEGELRKRRDFRDECVFSIDPATARDLDDALSCRKVDEGVYEVGVHIADVSHFIQQGTELDKVAKDRATSVYLTQKVIPMLPNALCEELCSLNPGVERLAYSVIWTLKSDGTVLSEWFGKTVIRSCTKLSYDHAQTMIETENDSLLKPEDFPEIHNGSFSLSKISNTVKLLYVISKHLREQRFSSGALDFSGTDVAFNLDHESGMPNGCYVYDYKDSNRMIEEFMLLANMAVGHKIYQHHPKRAVLRCHPPPHEVMMEEVGNICRKFDIPFDVSDSGNVNKSLNNIAEIAADDGDVEESRETLLPALNLLCMKSFKNAKYFCTGAVRDERLYRHYALNVPIYTHFTSPIRRYPDVLVHRLLTAALDESYELKADTKELQMSAEHCTAKKLGADMAGEQSSQLFFAIYIMEHGPLLEKGVVVGVSESSVDILCPQVGLVTRVYLKDLPALKHFQYRLEEERPTLTLDWKDSPAVIDDSVTISDNLSKGQTLTLFTSVKVALSVRRNQPTKIHGELVNPNQIDPLSGESLKEQSL